MKRRCRACHAEVPSDERVTACPACGAALAVAPTLPTGMPAVTEPPQRERHTSAPPPTRRYGADDDDDDDE